MKYIAHFWVDSRYIYTDRFDFFTEKWINEQMSNRESLIFIDIRRLVVNTECLKKNGILWKNGHNFLQTHPKCKIWGCFGKFRIFATLWALRFSKLKKKWLRKWSLKLPTPSPKIGKILCSQFTLIDPLSHSLGHYGLWTWHIRPRIQNYLYFSFYQCVEQILLSLQVMKMQRIIKGVHNVSSEFCRFLEGGLATSGFIFSGISSSILKISVPIM